MQNSEKTRQKLDQYFTPLPLAKACIEVLRAHKLLLPTQHILEPSCGDGNFLAALAGHQGFVIGIDLDSQLLDEVLRRPDCADTRLSVIATNFLTYRPTVQMHWVIGNPPYSQATDFILHARGVLGLNVAYLLRADFLGSMTRWEQLFRHPEFRPTDVWYINPRPSFVGGKTGQYQYAWVVWGPPTTAAPRLHWLIWEK